MKKLSAVIGANFGDEGKGLFTDFLAHQENHRTLVVRYNGGAQAGHTVVAPDSRRHVFHHFGSGTLSGNPSYLAKHFIVNPIIFVDEWRKLTPLLSPLRPVVYVDLRARVTTPWDMMVNQARETARSMRRHGSCGLGIHETVERHKIVPLMVGDLLGPASVWHEKVRQIRADYYPTRLVELGLEDFATDAAMHDGLLDGFFHDCNIFKECISGTPEWSREFLDGCYQVIFEGAQGLRLDSDSSYFPHVTCSRTGLTNVIELMRDAELMKEPLHAYYVTRPYVTRHGNGPLKHELERELYGITDATNVKNQWQGNLRFGLFDVDEFNLFVHADHSKGKMAGIDVNPQLVLTCVDQIPEEFVDYVTGGKTVRRHWKSLASDAMTGASLRDAYIGKGPTRDDVRSWP